jgi:hypothetical protein
MKQFTKLLLTCLLAFTRFTALDAQKFTQVNITPFNIPNFQSTVIDYNNDGLDGDYEQHNVALHRSDSYLVIDREGILLTPNPTTDKNVKVGINVKRDKRVSVQVSDANGRLLFTQDVSCKRGMNTYQLLPSNLSLLSKGMYIVQAIGLDEDNISRLIVQ